MSATAYNPIADACPKPSSSTRALGVRAIAARALRVRDGRSPVEAARIAGVDPNVAEWLCGHWIFRILRARRIRSASASSPSAGPARRALESWAHIPPATMKKVERVVSLFCGVSGWRN
ncbi:MAG: hypothetical protein R3C97_13400 [Geminicoccaceae bacterium]